jgi:XTP/dITP diphosphohydrolase
MIGSRLLYLASSNPDKLREFRQAAAGQDVSVEALPRSDELTACVEDGATFEDNARKKAVHYSRNFPELVFADDSGISVDALNGRPGVNSARFAGPDATDDENNELLLTELHRVETARRREAGESPRPHGLVNRSAHYDCVIALAKHGEVLAVVEGRVAGIILDAPRGARGFGYDPLFFYPPLGKTFAEISPEEKFAVSHRGVAFRMLLDYLAKNPRIGA